MPKDRFASSDEWVVVGKITRTHGVRGELYVRDDSDNPDRFVAAQQFRTSHGRYPMLVLKHTRPGPHGVIAEFAGITSVEAARTLLGAELSIKATDRRTLGTNEFWPDQLVGLEVRDASGPLGTVTDVILGPQDRLVVACTDGTTGELPFVDALVPEVNVAEGWVRIDPPDGLFSPR